MTDCVRGHGRHETPAVEGARRHRRGRAGPDRRNAPGRTRGGGAPGRGRPTLALPRRTWRVRLISSVSTPFCSIYPARLTSVGALHLLVRRARARLAPTAPWWGRRRRAACCDRRCLGRSGRPLLRAAWLEHRGPPEARDVLRRRLIPGFGAAAGQDCDSASQSIFADGPQRLPTRRPRRRTPWRERPAAGTDCRLLRRSVERSPTERGMLERGSSSSLTGSGSRGGPGKFGLRGRPASSGQESPQR